MTGSDVIIYDMGICLGFQLLYVLQAGTDKILDDGL